HRVVDTTSKRVEPEGRQTRDLSQTRPLCPDVICRIRRLNPTARLGEVDLTSSSALPNGLAITRRGLPGQACGEERYQTKGAATSRLPETFNKARRFQAL